jgi:hypothetical protein
MAIIPIKDIPSSTSSSPTQRDLIRADIREAIRLGVTNFEFDDDRYKYSTLVGNAKEAYKSLFIKEIYNPSVVKAEKRLRKEYPEEEFSIPSCSTYMHKTALFSARKQEDRIHVYCALDLNLINGMDGYLYIDALKTLYRKKQQ